MEARATGKYIKGAPQKARLVIDVIRGKSVPEALAYLRFSKKRAAVPIAKVLNSAVANATSQSAHVDEEELFVKEASVDIGPTKWRRRLRPAPMGRAHRQMRRQSHITICVSNGKSEEE
ncbi:MAG TPA: 50S ribosomal protein L22 [Acidobacteriota bacterium]|nr:50S ribosomal protein L22 [Acidobacteriota bacterium]